MPYNPYGYVPGGATVAVARATQTAAKKKPPKKPTATRPGAAPVNNLYDILDLLRGQMYTPSQQASIANAITGNQIRLALLPFQQQQGLLRQQGNEAARAAEQWTNAYARLTADDAAKIQQAYQTAGTETAGLSQGLVGGTKQLFELKAAEATKRLQDLGVPGGPVIPQGAGIDTVGYTQGTLPAGDLYA